MKNIIATFVSLLAFAVDTTNAKRRFYHVHGGLDKRQTTDECGYGDTCVEACGQGFINCWDSNYCFNPSAGETCCANGGGVACPSAWYCVETPGGGVGCCPSGDSLDQCHASISISPVATDATLASTAASVSDSSSPRGSSSPNNGGVDGSSSSSSSGAQITRAAVMWGAETIGLAVAGLGVALPFL